MPTYINMMRTILIATAILILFQSLSGCAARREAARALLPTADTVCLVIQGIGDPGAPFIRRKAASYLAAEGFHLVEANCDITITYTSFNHGQWEMLAKSLFGTKSTNAWRTEGVVALHRGTTPIIEDRRIDLRDYPTMLDLLDTLASQIVGVVPEYYRPVAPQNP